MNFSEEKIMEVRQIVYGIKDKINAWDKDGLGFACMEDHQFAMMKLCGHERAAHDLHRQEIEALEYVLVAMNVLCSKLGPNGDGNGGNRNEEGGK